MKRYIPAIIVSATLLIIAGGFGLAYRHDQVQKSQAQQAAAAQAAAQAQKQEETAAQAAQKQAQKTAALSAAQKSLNDCLSGVNQQAIDAIKNGADPSTVTPVNQSFIAQCQDLYNSNVNQINAQYGN